ncbi:efflux RND transporter permease subunit [Pararhodobacter sp.]|uniref:efflux RND transporter permease subunit n=1 Tax=Pararhodobacter sp. TaxID=2127056 RepID=UPI002AFFE40E|nr:efflux RND transporter permease subunit [Pararhodobacter sp.]
MIRWFAKHPTAANLLLLLFLAVGAMTLPTLVRETFPDFRDTEVEITVAYRGATAGEVEDAICRPLWDSVQGVESLKELTCRAQDNLARAVAVMASGGDVIRFVNAIRTEVGAIDSFPDRADPALVRELFRTDVVASVAVSGAMPLHDLDLFADGLADRIAALPEIALVNRSGLGTRQFRIEASRAVLAQHGLTVAGLAAVLGAQSLDQPVGTLETPGSDLRLRLTEERRSIAELADLPVLVLDNGARLVLGDVATITETHLPAEERAYLDGVPAILLEIHKPRGTDALRALEVLRGVITRESEAAPASLQVLVVQDTTSIVRDRLAMLVRNGAMGLVLVVIVMSLFFRPGLALWAAMGLPVAMAGALAWMAVTGLTLNMITMTALLMAIGIVMDDSIVLSDSIAVEAAKGGHGVDAVVRGALAVVPGVSASFMTTVAVFGPLSFLSGTMGKVLEVLPIVLIAALAASLIEAFLILPHHLRHEADRLPKPPGFFRRTFDGGFEKLRDGMGWLADQSIKARYLTTGLAIAGLVLTVGGLASGIVKREAFPDIDGDVVEARIMMPQGTPLARTEIAVAQVEAALAEVNAAFTPDQPDAQSLVIRRITRFNRNLSAGETGAHVATISVDLLGAETRATTLDGFTTAWREAIGALPGAASLIITEPGLGPQGVALELRMTHRDLDVLQQNASLLLHELQTYRGVRNASINLRPGKPELRLTLTEGAPALGLTSAEVANQLRAAFLGASLTEVRTGAIAHDIELILTLEDRDQRADLSDFTFLLADGRTVPLDTVLRISEARGWGTITHVDGLRSVTIEADVDPRLGNADAITADLRAGFLPSLIGRVPGLQVHVEGQAANLAETSGSILRGFAIGLLGIYLVLSFQFRSYTEPVIVMLTIPLALIGVVWGHWLMGYDISMPSMMGAASLAGIVVNNAILLVEVIKARRAEGLLLAHAAGEAVRARFRPILITVSTTVIGMVPLLTEASLQAQVLKPLVVALVFGMLASTLLVLLVLPAFYAILDDLGLARKSNRA